MADSKAILALTAEQFEGAWLDTCPSCGDVVSAIKHDFGLCTQVEQLRRRIFSAERQLQLLDQSSSRPPDLRKLHGSPPAEVVARMRGLERQMVGAAPRQTSQVNQISQIDEDPSAICGIVSYSGPNREPLACGYRPKHDGEHSWATLPTFTVVSMPWTQTATAASVAPGWNQKLAQDSTAREGT